jgi:pSer/pThr/pTyr-binding forkhead associated (FHA) protein
MSYSDDHDGEQTEPDPGQQGGGREPPAASASGASIASEQGFGLKFILPGGESKLFTAVPVMIGRAANNDIVLADETVSAQHAQVYYDDKAQDICIIDLDSLNGLFIGDQPTRKNILYDGVKIGLGRSGLIFRNTGFIYPG